MLSLFVLLCVTTITFRHGSVPRDCDVGFMFRRSFGCVRGCCCCFPFAMTAFARRVIFCSTATSTILGFIVFSTLLGVALHRNSFAGASNAFNATQNFTAAISSDRNTKTNFSTVYFESALGRAIGGVHWRASFALVNFDVEENEVVTFTLLTTPQKIVQYTDAIASLTAAELRRLEVTSIVRTELAESAPKDNMWVLGVIGVGLTVAGVVVSFAERKMRTARARRKARAVTAATNDTSTGMLADN